ncbi:hypothetical protein A0H81_13301 [Grifola frondosa]|uniref:SWI/SNF chromatin-remodeling complex subunit snf5 n=1 Tax=Grifola frondosa TaxID=5627 RepID=A0A1C7LQJ2_GRIFR|nr:hypothetical protein A0H81_13301 [Grifola frondosa]
MNPQPHADAQSQSINPALLAAFQQQSQQPQYAQQQNSAQNLNPQQLQQLYAARGINPQMFQQGNMGAMGGINPAALSAGMNMAMQGASSPPNMSPPSHHAAPAPNPNPPPNPNAGVAGPFAHLTQAQLQQLAQMSPQQVQHIKAMQMQRAMLAQAQAQAQGMNVGAGMGNMGANMAHAAQLTNAQIAQLSMQHQRPSSSSSSGSHSQRPSQGQLPPSMMPPPSSIPPRPPTAGHGYPARSPTPRASSQIPSQSPHAQSGPLPPMSTPQQQQHHQQKPSPTHQSAPAVQPPPVYAPIAPAPVPTPGSPYRGMKRKVSGTPAPAPFIGNAPMGMPGGLGPGSAQGLVGGAGGGMMGPPVVPRSTMGDMSGMGMGLGMGGGMNGYSMQGARHVSGEGVRGGMSMMDAGPGQPLNVNTNVGMGMNMGMGMGMNMGMGMGMGMGTPVQTPTHTSPTTHMGIPGPMNAMGMASSPTNAPPMSASDSSRSMGSMNLGVGTHGAGMGGVDMSLPVPIPQTPLRQPSLPPSAPPFPAISSSSTTMTMMSGASTQPPVSGGKAPPSVKVEAAPAASLAPVTKVVPQLPPLPAGVSLDQAVTRVSVVALAESAQMIPPLSEQDIVDVQGWMKIDREYETRLKKMRERMVQELRETVAAPRAWWEKDPMEDVRSASRRRPEKFVLTGMRGAKERERKRHVGGRGRGGVQAVAPEDANRPEQLVPIRLEFDVEHHKMRDTFVWNLNDPIITPEIFAQSVVDDYSLAPSYHAVITKAIQDQLSDYKAHSTTFGEDGANVSDEPAEAASGSISEDEAVWWESWRKRLHSGVDYKKMGARADTNRSRKRRKVVKEETVDRLAGTNADIPVSVEDLEEDESKMHEEMRILVKLDIIVGSVKLEDQLEWDLENEDPSPEQFAEIYTRELGLGGEFKTSIAHSIREQVQIYQKSLFLVGHPSDGSAVQDDDLRMSLLPSLSTGARSMDQVIAFTPLLNYLSEGEVERNEKEREKELNRRRRKAPRGRRGVALPDREPPKTFRTPAIGFPEIDPALLALVSSTAAPTRRAAAAAASLTIANMVASENGTVVLPQSLPTPIAPVAPSAPKEKKVKGLFKAPPYPSSVLRPRANVKAPTPSTAADISSLLPPIENDIPAPSSSGAADSKGAKVVLTAKRVKELEREAKEKEYADGKFWHRHRRPRPVVYNSSAEYHLGLIKDAENAKVAAKRKRPQSAVADEPTPSAAPTVDGDMEAETPGPVKAEVWVEVPPTPATPALPVQPDAAERAISPVSTASSASEPPLAQRMLKTNGASHSKSAPPAASLESPHVAPAQTAASPPRASPRPAAPSSVPPNIQVLPLTVPQWLQEAMVAMQVRYPDDHLEVTSRKGASSGTPEWRIKCVDCPGKLYTPGPGETLSNFEVHLKNRQHRAKVNSRIGAPAGAPISN